MNRLHVLLAIIGILGAVLPTAALATIPWDPLDPDAAGATPPPGFSDWPGTPPWSPERLGERPQVSYLEMLADAAHFEQTMQVLTPGPDFGGIREGENMMNIIQTDNTSESIWLWSRYYEVTGDDQYHENILNSFTYSLNHPAYLEEQGSDSTTGYYRMYNCGWAVMAEQKYRDIYGDTTYKAYSDSCASYIRYHTLVRQTANYFPPILAWAEGNLYLAGVHENNQAWIDRAIQQSRDKVKLWVEQSPATLGIEGWAMTGGATMWGMCNSYFRAVPDSAAPWIGRYISYMDNFSGAGQFQNAWNGWYAYGHLAAGLTLNDPGQLAIHVALTDTLMAEDGDLDGAIPARHQDGNATDQSWVTSYLFVFGLSHCVGPTSVVQWQPPESPVLWLSGGTNPSTGPAQVSFRLDRSTRVDLAVYDAAGRRVAGLLQGPGAAGRHDIVWNARTEGGAPVAAGVYWVSLLTPQGRSSRPVVIVR